MTADLTWPALLAHWTDFARSSLALPKSAEGDRWRAAVAPIIGLQAVTFALGDLDRLRESDDERALALDKAELLIDRHAAELRSIWRGGALHAELDTIIADASRALAAAKAVGLDRPAQAPGLEWTVASERLVTGHPGELVESLLAAEFRGDLLLPVPGVPLFRGAPAAFLRDPTGIEACSEQVEVFLASAGKVWGPKPLEAPRQVHRQFDFGKGGPVRDLVVPLDGLEIPGQPLLIWAIRRGEARPVPLPIRGQAADTPVLPVNFSENR